jgi:hypothetical protein
MHRLVSLVACGVILVSSAALAQGRPDSPGKGMPPAGAPKQDPHREPMHERDREHDRDWIRGDGKGNPNEEAQERQKRCQERAKDLKAEEHQRFMQQCMGNVPDAKGGGEKRDKENGGKPDKGPDDKGQKQSR